MRLIHAVILGAINCGSILCHATPIVVLRTGTGFVVGTNGHRAGRLDACKLHYSANDVLLMGANYTAIVDKTTRKYDFDIDDEIWRAFRLGLTGDKLLEAIQTQIEASVKNHLRQFLAINEKNFQFHLVLVHFSAGNAIVYARVLTMDEATNWTPQLFPQSIVRAPIPLGVGEMLVFENKYPTHLRYKNETDLRKQLAIQDTSEDFAPPFLIDLLDAQGFTLLDPDNGVCTAAHPIPVKAK